MSKFTAKTSITRSFDYKVSEDDKKSATYYGQSIISLRENAKIVYPISSLEFVIKNESYFTEGAWFFHSSVNGAPLKSPIEAFKDGHADAKSYFKGLYDYQYNSITTLLGNQK